ncbi:hypothetical protein MyNCGM121_60250 [Achromobacter xylosoxidans]
MSDIELPEGTYFSDANPSGPWFDAADMRAYAAQAVREALAALKIDERAAFEDWVRMRHPESPSMLWREDEGYVYVNSEWDAWQARASLIPENNHE